MPRLPVVLDDRLGRAQTVRRIVVDRVVHGRAVVDDVVPGSREVLDQVVLQFEAGMVGADVHSHGPKSCTPYRQSGTARSLGPEPTYTLVT